MCICYLRRAIHIDVEMLACVEKRNSNITGTEEMVANTRVL